MKSALMILLAACLTSSVFAPAAHARVNVERTGSENPVVEVARSTIYGGLAGLVVGSALALASSSSDGQVIRWCFVGGTMVGLLAGTYYVAHRPSADAVLQLDGGTLQLHPPTFERAPLGGSQVPLVAVRF